MREAEVNPTGREGSILRKKRLDIKGVRAASYWGEMGGGGTRSF